MPLRAVLFDVDGTLADTEAGGHLPAYNAAFAERGLPWHWTTALYQTLSVVPGGSARLDYYLDRFGPPVGRHAAALAHDRQRWIARLHAAKGRHFLRCVRAGAVALRAGSARLIAEIDAAGLAVGLVSNASMASVSAVVAGVLSDRLRACIDVVICGDDVVDKKPAPEGYRTACAALGCAPGEALAIEDSRLGLLGASAAGIPTLITYNAQTRDQNFVEAAAVVDGLGETGRRAVVERAPCAGCERVDLAVLTRLHAAATRA